MKTGNAMFLLALTLVNGCRMGETGPPQVRASLAVLDNKMCISIAPEGDEKIVRLDIYDEDHKYPILEKHNLSLVTSKDQCLPDYGIDFEMGKLYQYDIVVDSDSKRNKEDFPSARIFFANFILRDSSRGLEFTTSAWCDDAPEGISSSWRKKCLANR